MDETARADRLAYFEAIYRGFERAIVAAGGPVDRFFDIGGFSVRMRFAGPALMGQLTPALEHLEIEAEANPALTLCAWDSVCTGTKLPLMVSSLLRLVTLAWYDQLNTRFEIKEYNDDRIRTTFHLGPNILSALDIERNLAVYWLENAHELPYYERGSPFRTILNWWTATRGRQYVHAAAIGTASGGVVLAGKGGVGKSTTALACLESGLLYASDDYCLVATEPMPYVYSLYNTVKLDGEDDIERFPHVQPMVSNIDRAKDEKLMVFLQRHYPERMARGFPIRAVLLPRITGGAGTRLQPATAGAALSALAPSTVLQLPGTGQSALRFMSQLVKQVPCYILELGLDLSAIPAVILDLLSEPAISGDLRRSLPGSSGELQ
jgi:hypothetical protein